MKIKSTKFYYLLLVFCMMFSERTHSQTINYADSVINFSTQYTTVNWAAYQALGYPDTYPTYGDIPTAWASLSSGSQREFLELHFYNAMPIDSIWIYETLGCGAVDTVYVRNPGTMLWEVVYSGPVNSVVVAQIFKVGFPMTAFAVSDVRIAINSPAVASWNEIDAVAIVNSTRNLISICNGDSALINSNYENTAGVHEDSILVDSDINYLTLSVVNSSTSSINPTACNSYVSPSGLYLWITSNTYMDTILNVVGCDSIITVNLTINTVDASIVSGGITASAVSATGTYQWLDYDNAFAILPGETNQDFTATINGMYSVAVTDNGCTDTSNCFVISEVGIETTSNDLKFTAYPNPTSGIINLVFAQKQESIQIIIKNSLGQIIQQTSFSNQDKIALEINEAPGIYFVEVKVAQEESEFVRILVRD